MDLFLEGTVMKWKSVTVFLPGYFKAQLTYPKGPSNSLVYKLGARVRTKYLHILPFPPAQAFFPSSRLHGRP